VVKGAERGTRAAIGARRRLYLVINNSTTLCCYCLLLLLLARTLNRKYGRLHLMKTRLLRLLLQGELKCEAARQYTYDVVFFFIAFLSSPYRETPKNAPKKNR
jgi:hypothetical protein